MRLEPTTESDLQQISNWTHADPWHKDRKSPEWWLTGQGTLSFAVQDEVGVIFYSRVDREGDWFRYHCQFAPREDVSRERVMAGLEACLKIMPELFRQAGGIGIRFDSESPSLIKFLAQRRFRTDPAGDFVMVF